jgi:HEAT repeat protein
MKILACITLFLVALPTWASDTAYRTGGEAFADTWRQFYELRDNESALDDPLIRRGKAMIPAICEAIEHKDMKARRYAISALGYIKDPSALPCLERILQDPNEIDYFRGDALLAIYRIDEPLGRRYADRYKDENSHLARCHDLIENNSFALPDETGLE